MTQQGDQRFEARIALLRQQVADACRGLQNQPVTTAPNVPLPDYAISQLRQQERRQAGRQFSNAQTILDNGEDAYRTALQDPNLSTQVSPSVRVLTPAGMQRVLQTGMIPDATIQGLSNGGLQNVQQAQQILQRGGDPAQLLTRDFSNFMHSFSASRAVRSPAAPSAIEQICSVVEPQHPPRTPATPHQGGFGQPNRPTR